MSLCRDLPGPVGDCLNRITTARFKPDINYSTYSTEVLVRKIACHCSALILLTSYVVGRVRYYVALSSKCSSPPASLRS